MSNIHSADDTFDSSDNLATDSCEASSSKFFKNDSKFKPSSSENNISISPRDEKKLNKTKSWSCKENFEKEHQNIEQDLTDTLRGLEITESIIESNPRFNSDNTNLVNARDSLEQLMKDEQNMPKRYGASVPYFVSSKHSPDSPKSSPMLHRPSTSSFDSKNRKNRKDYKKHKITKPNNDERPKMEDATTPNEGSNNNSSILKQKRDKGHTNEMVECEEAIRCKYFPKNSKSVVFTNEVLVMYFNNEDIVSELKEPLKKEVEQQERNKEMRRCHLVKTQERDNLCLY